LAPHPDDETLGCAGIIQRARKVGASVNVVYLTNGDSNQIAFIVFEKRLVFRKRAFIHMGEVRRKEAIAAMKLLGLSQENLIFLGYPDFGIMAIFKNYWNTSKPFKSLLTRVSSVPYQEDFSYGKPYIAENILLDLKKIIEKIKPNKIFITSPLDTNSDHRAFYLFLRLALLDLGEEFSKNIKVYPFIIHHLNWPKPRHYHPALKLYIPPDMLQSGYSWYNLNLSSDEIKNKHNAVLAYKSQTESSAFYLLSFVRKNELFLVSQDISLKSPAYSQDAISWSNSFDMPFCKESEDDLSDNSLNYSNPLISFGQNLKEKTLSIKISLNKQPIMTNLSVYLFGYEKQTDFALMPKIRVKVIGDTVSILDGRKKIRSGEVSLRRENKDIIVTLPLQILNDPEIIFCSVNTSTRSLSYDSNAWSVVDLK
jgi:LmbE family N-acetylglucosaminyl deacetylase